MTPTNDTSGYLNKGIYVLWSEARKSGPDNDKPLLCHLPDSPQWPLSSNSRLFHPSVGHTVNTKCRNVINENRSAAN